MALFHVIEQIDISHEGPIAFGQKIHLAQGDMDGACGPYCLMMCLIILNLIKRDDLTNLKLVDGKTSAGKLLNLLKEYNPLFRDGTYDEDLIDLLKKSYITKLDTNKISGSGVEIRNKLIEYLDQDNPVILAVESGADFGHWVVVIGYEYSYDEKDQKKVMRLLFLDPGVPAPLVSAWNGVVDAIGTKGRYPYEWWGKEDKVAFTTALALSLK